MYEYIEQILGSYFGSSNEESEEEAIQTLRKHLQNSPTLAKELCAELNSAFDSNTYSWKKVLAAHDVFFANSEIEAKSYARKILWEALYLPEARQ